MSKKRIKNKRQINAEKYRQERLGLKGTNNFGLEMEIVEYIQADNITVKFSDGTTVRATYNRFLTGGIENPNNNIVTRQRQERIGTRFCSNAGLWATVIDYNTTLDVTIRFDSDGVITKKDWFSLQKGRFSHPSKEAVKDKNVRLGEKRLMNNGLEAEIVAYRDADHIDVQFTCDGEIAHDYTYNNFLTGGISHPIRTCAQTLSLQEFAIRYYLKKYGFIKIEKGTWQDKGFGKYELDFYHPEKNIAIEYDGAIHSRPVCIQRDILKNQKCKDLDIKLYRLRDYTCPQLQDNYSTNFSLQRDTVVHRLSDCKKELEYILTENNIAFNKNDINFYRDCEDILNQHLQSSVRYREESRVGQRVFVKSANQYATIIDYYSSENITIQFDDGTVVKNVSYNRFKRGSATHPSNTTESHAKRRLGEIKLMNCGLEAKIIAYREANDIDIQFLHDGSIRAHTKYHTFQQGRIKPIKN